MRKSAELLESHAAQISKLSLSTFTSEPDDPAEEHWDAQTFILIKGNPASLKFLGEFFVRFSEGDEGRTFFMHPQGPGSNHFSTDSSVGIYLEDCSEK